MSTRSRIGIEKNGIISSVYVNFYGKRVGEFLKYYTLEEIEKIICLGDLSSLGKTLSTSVFYGRDIGKKGVYRLSYNRKEALKLPGGEIFYLYSVDEDNRLLINTSIDTFLPLPL